VKTDEELLGGVVVELEGRVYDGSIRTRLARLAARMSGE
jgi:F0F1-type ATP synthase delta subunit